MKLAILLAASTTLYGASALEDILSRSGKAAESFWVDFAAINCQESVVQTKLAPNGHSIAVRQAAYDYLVVARLAPDDLRLNESRMPVGKVSAPRKEKNYPMLVTSGFPSLLLIFHPFFQGSYEYAPPEEDTLDGKPVLRVSFRHVRNARSPSCLRLRGRDYPIEWRGKAWLDRSSGVVLKIEAELNASMEDVGLTGLRAEVRYAPVRFKDAASSTWLPAEAVIEASSPQQRWRNTHRFTEYKHFSVDTTSTVERPHEP